MLFLFLLFSIFFIFAFGIGVSMFMAFMALFGVLFFVFITMSFTMSFAPVSMLLVAGLFIIMLFMFGKYRNENISKYYLAIAVLCGSYMIFQMICPVETFVYINDFQTYNSVNPYNIINKKGIVILGLIVAFAILFMNNKNRRR